MECLNMKILCFGVILVLTIVFGSFHEAVAEDCNGMSGLLIARIRNLEKRMDLDLKIMKSELKRELNSGKKRRSNGDSTLLYEIRTIQTSMQQLFSGLETFKTELLLRQQNVTANLLGTVASLQGDVRTLTSKVDSMQMKLSRVDESVANLTKSVEDIDIEIIDSTEPPLTTQTTSFYNYTAPPPLSGAVRLVGNSGTTNAGTVEVYADGRWGSICDDDWDRDDAEVVCRMLGYGTVIGVYGEARYGQSSSADIHLDGIDCTGDETSILDCRHNGIGNTDCSHAEDAGVECANPQTTTYSDGIQYRLVDGPDSYAGRVEVRYQGEWGTVCDDEFDDSEATVVCRSLGISDRGLARIEAFYGTGSGSILMDGLQCTGSERFLHDCDFNGWRVSDCSHGEDASVTCEAGGGFTTPGMTTMPSGVQYRLVGPNPYAGRVEVYYGGEWGTVCDDGFDEREAIVLCSLMGYKLRDITPVVKTEAYYGSGSGPIHMDDLNCQGTESSLEQCPFPGWDVQNCGHSEDVGVNCYGDGGSTPPPLTTTSTSRTTAEPVLVRLVDGPSELSGRVEVYRDGVWGTVCDDDFDYKEAAVICRSLGFSGGVSYQEAKFGRGTGPIWLDDLKCQGGESSLGDCRFNGWNNSNCGHEEDASVGCEPAPTTVATTTSSAAAMIRLADGPGSWEGRVEVYHDNEWGTVCDDEFDNNEAKIVCRMLGLKGGKAFQGSEKYPPGSGTILMDDLMCTGNESSLFDCGFNGWGVSNCGHGEDAGVQCVMPVRVESIRLVDGESENVGRVEITVNGANGTICDDDFDYKAATVVCRMLGYMNGGESYIEARYGEGSGQVILDDVICTGNESSLAECSHRQPFTSNCEHDEDVSVRCFLPNTSTTFEPFVNFTEISPFTPEFVNFTEYIPETESAGSNVTGDQPEDLMKSAPGSPPPNIRGRPVGNNTVLIEWNESRTSNQSIQGYKIFYTTDPSYPLALWDSVVAAAESRAANITGLVSNTTYSFAILAFNTYGSGPLSQLIQVFTRSWSHKGVPLQLLNAIALAISPNEIRMRISWDPIERKRDDVITYVVQYNDSEARELGSLTFYRAPGLGEVDVTLADLTPDTIYHIQVIGSGYLEEVARSDIIQARTPAFIPGPPKEVQVQVINGTGISVTWRPPLKGVGSGIIRRYAVYLVEVNELNNPITAENVKETLDGNRHELAIFGLTPSARYRLQVAGYTRRGDGIRSSPAYVIVEGVVGRITDPPKDMKVADDHIVSFFCKASGYPPLKFYWEKAGKRLGDRKAGRYQVFSMPNGTVLRIQPVREKRDNRTFTCVATNEHGEVRASAVLSVYPSSLTDDLPSGYPRIVENPVLKTVEKDHAVTLSCRATTGGSSNPPEIYWLKDEMPLNTEDPRLHISDEGTLTIERCLESDQGKYECVAENAVGVAYSFAAFLYVKAKASPPKIYRQSDKEIYFGYGMTVRLECVASGIPEPEYRWERNGLPFNPDAGRIFNHHNGTGTLTFNPAFNEDQGYYQCFAENGYGVSLSVKTHLIAAKLDVFPEGRTRTLQVDPGESLVLRCIPPRSIPGPATSVYWAIQVDNASHEHKPVNTDKRITISREGDLVFANVRKSDERGGRGYLCLVTNRVLSMMVSSSLTYIQVRDGPERLSPPQLLWRSPSDNFALVGQDFKLQCIFAGNPTPDVTWEWDRWDSVTKISITDGGTALEFKNVTTAVERDYICRGQNTQSSTVSEAGITVRIEAAPFWTTRPQDQETREGDSVTFNCEASGTPVPTSQWFIDGVPILESSRASRITKVSDSLIIDDVRSDDHLNVQCNMTNKHGYVFGEASLRVGP